MRIRQICPVLLLALLSVNVPAGVVINEIFYHAPNDVDELQFVELHNAGDHAVDLSGWSLKKGIHFRFETGARIAPQGYLVLCRNREVFDRFFDVPVVGVFAQHLGKSSGHLELCDTAGRVVDSVRYQDAAPWPTGPDGYSASLERICPDQSGDIPENWAGSPLSPDRTKPGGTPGKPNANYSAVLPPVISGVTFGPENPLPDPTINVHVTVRDRQPVTSVRLVYQLAGPGFESPEASVPLENTSADRYTAQIPGQTNQALIRFRIEALNQSGARRVFPSPTDPRPALSIYVSAPIVPAKIPFGWIIDTTQSEFLSAQQRARFTGFRGFGPGRFGPGFRTGGRGFGPGPFEEPRNVDTNETARALARKRLLTELDLAAAWYELTFKEALDADTVKKLQPIFATLFSERGKLLDDIVESPKIQEKLAGLDAVVASFRTRVGDSVRPIVTEQAAQRFQQALQDLASPSAKRAGAFFSRPREAVRNWINLENAWDALTSSGNLSRIPELRAIFQEAEQKRAQLVSEAAELQRPEDGLRELRERADSLKDELVAKVKPALSPAQLKHLDLWEHEPESVGLARNPSPPERGGSERGGPAFVFGPGPAGFGGARGGFRGRPGPGGATGGSASGKSAFVYFDPASGKTELYDYVDVVPRSGGQKIHFHKDHPFHQMTTVNLIFEGETAVLVEPLAYEVFKRAGVPSEQSYHVRLTLDGERVGYYLLIEQPNRAFLRRNGIRDDGNLYKILWYEQGVVGQHEKKTHVQTGHDDIVSLVDALQKSAGEEQWRIIRDNFDVEEVLNYFVASMALSNWDGFFNNYFTYHDLQGTGRWSMIPWDEDQTWGVVGMMRGEVFYNMPVTFGMNGDAPPGETPGSQPGRGNGFGFGFGPGWWRQPGWFSGPLLANPQFRKLFLARLKEFLATGYTEEVFTPIIDRMADRLKDEVALRAQITGQQPEEARADFQQQIQHIRDHLTKRREFLLAQDEVKTAGPFSRDDLQSLNPAGAAPSRRKAASKP